MSMYLRCESCGAALPRGKWECRYCGNEVHREFSERAASGHPTGYFPARYFPANRIMAIVDVDGNRTALALDLT